MTLYTLKDGTVVDASNLEMIAYHDNQYPDLLVGVDYEGTACVINAEPLEDASWELTGYIGDDPHDAHKSLWAILESPPTPELVRAMIETACIHNSY